MHNTVALSFENFGLSPGCRNHADQLTMKVLRPVLVMMRSVPGDSHDRTVPAGQPHRHVPVGVQAGACDSSRADDFSTLIIRDPHVCHVRTRLLPAICRGIPEWSMAGGLARRCVPTRTASPAGSARSVARQRHAVTSPTVS